MSFFSVSEAGQLFNEQPLMMGESFTYQGQTLRGVFDQVDIDWQFADFSFRKITALILVTSKAQWVAAGVTPANREVVTFHGVNYPVQSVAGESEQEPAWTLTLFKNT